MSEEKETRREKRQRELDAQRPPEMFRPWASQPISGRLIIGACLAVSIIAFCLILFKAIF